MRLRQNEKHITIRRKVGEAAPFVGLLVLAVSTILVFTMPDLIWLSMILVWMGLLISLLGSYLGSRYVGTGAHYHRVPEGLKGLDKQYALLMYTTPVPFVLLDPGGLTVISVKAHDGTITYENGKWRLQQRMGAIRRFAGQEGLGKPELMLEAEIDSLSRWLGKVMPEGTEVPVRGLVLMSSPDAQINLVDDPPVPVLRMKALKRWLRKDGKRSKLDAETMAALEDVLGLGEE